MRTDLIVADGTVTPGFSVGHIDVAGNYLQGESGILRIDVDGAAAAGEFDTLPSRGPPLLMARFGLTPRTYRCDTGN